jgi:hypothetical protein
MFSSRFTQRVIASAFVLASTIVSSAAADPPVRVARVSYLSGAVSFRPASVDEWTTATLNYPLTIGDHLWTGRGARTELELGSAFVRLAPETEFSVMDLDDDVAQLRITQGALTVRVRSLAPDEAVEIDTPNGAISLVRPGFYRIDVSEGADSSTVTVRSGDAEVTAGGASLAIAAAQTVSLVGEDQTSANVQNAMPADDFEDWCLARDRRDETAVATRYVPADMPGYADLDQYGAWQQGGDYGPVWIPRVRAEWVPYRYGHWVWIDPWGWTWIDDAPWGFAPFHYGRWVHLSAGWAWAPGRIVARPVYAPALVAFVGGAGWQASVRVGSEPVAWFPLGPREPFVPGYRVSERYVQRVNVTHVNVTTVNVTNITYVNRAVPGAVTAVPRDAFVRARPVGAVAVAVPRESIRSAPSAAAAAVAPQPASRIGEGARASAPPAAAVNRPVVVRRPPPEGGRAPVRRAEAPSAPRGPRATPPVQAPPPNPRAPERPQTPPPSPAPPSPRVPERPQAQPRTPPPPQPAQPPPPRPEPPQPQRAAPPPKAVPRQTPNVDADLAARHAQERAQLDTRHAAERAALQSRHQQEEQAAHDGKQKQQLRQQHQQEQKAVQERQRQEREAVQKRQQDERRKKGGA